MSKQVALLTAALIAIAAQGVGYAADTNSPRKDNTTQQNPNDPSAPNPTQTDPQATPSDRPASAASDKTNRPQDAKDNEAYQAKLKICDGMSNANDKKACTDKARKESQM
jgi:hypothetical protein